MSYARFGEGDIYLYPTAGEDDQPLWVCCLCLLDSSSDVLLTSLNEAFNHVNKHIEANHVVPARCVERFKKEIKNE